MPKMFHHLAHKKVPGHGVLEVLDLNSGQSNSLWEADPGMGSEFLISSLEILSNGPMTINLFSRGENGWMHLYSLDVQSRNTSQLTYGDGIVEQYHLNKEENYILFTTNVNDIHARHIGKIFLDSKKCHAYKW